MTFFESKVKKNNLKITLQKSYQNRTLYFFIQCRIPYLLACFFFKLQEQNTVPSLRKALREVAMEKDAAVVSRVHIFVSPPAAAVVCSICVALPSHTTHKV